MEKSPHTLTLGEGRSNPFLRNIFQVDILYHKSRGQVVWQGSYLICIWKVKKMNSVKYNFIMLKNEMESYETIGGGV